MTIKCELCDRSVEVNNVGILTIKLEELVTEAEIGDALTLNVCYECIPTLVEGLKNSIVAVSNATKLRMEVPTKENR